MHSFQLTFSSGHTVSFEALSLAHEQALFSPESYVYQYLEDFVKNKSFNLQKVVVRDVRFTDSGFPLFGSMDIKYELPCGTKRDDHVQFRPPSVCCLPVVFTERNDTSPRYVLLTSQIRSITQSVSFLEIPAGSMDKNDGFRSRMIEELSEETGLEIFDDQLKVLSPINYRNRSEHYYYQYPSCGSYLERMYFFYVEIEILEEQLDHLLSRTHGNKAEGEKINLALYYLHEIPKVTHDSKSVMAYYMYAQFHGLL